MAKAHIVRVKRDSENVYADVQIDEPGVDQGEAYTVSTTYKDKDGKPKDGKTLTEELTKKVSESRAVDTRPWLPVDGVAGEISV